MNLQNVSNTLRLREYYFMFLRHKLVFVMTMTAGLFLSLIVAAVLPKIYRAETSLMVEDEKILNPLISGLAITPSVWGRMNHLREELLSWPRLTLVVEKLGMDKGLDKKSLQYERMIKRLKDNLSIRLRESNIVTVSSEGRDPLKAQQIVQTLGDVIIDGSLSSSKIEATSAIRFIEKQLDAYRAKLEESEDRLREFRELYASSLPVATRMNEQIVGLKMEMNNLMIENTEEHPRVIATQKLIERLEGLRDEQMAKTRDIGIEIDPEEYAKLITSVPRQEQLLQKLQRDYAVNDRIYESLLHRLETAKISETLETSDKGTDFRILEPARLPLEPVKPRKPLLLMGGLLLGLAFGAVIVYLLEMSDTSIRSLDEARGILELPIFGSIPPIRPEELLIEESMKEEMASV